MFHNLMKEEFKTSKLVMILHNNIIHSSICDIVNLFRPLATSYLRSMLVDDETSLLQNHFFTTHILRWFPKTVLEYASMTFFCN